MRVKDLIPTIKEVNEIFPGLREMPCEPTPGINGWFHTPELQSRPGEQNGMYGRKHTKETIAKMKANRKGKGFHNRNKGVNNPMYGKKRVMSEETKEKIRQGQLAHQERLRNGV